MSLIKLASDEFDILASKLERAGVRPDKRFGASHIQNKTFYQILSQMGYEEFRRPGARALKPDYRELGMTRAASKPTKEDQALYREVTGGGELTSEGLVCQGLLFDNDLITDRYSIGTLNCLVGLYDKYLGRANDFDHSFEVTQARARIIDLGLGTDRTTVMHPDTPISSLSRLSPSNPYSGVYTALYATLAFPALDDPHSIIERVQAGLIRDISIAWSSGGNEYCSVCLEPMEKFWFWTYCDEHGFPGGRTEAGEAVVEIVDAVADAFTFGFVSDGALKRAMLVVDPVEKESAEDDVLSIVAPAKLEWVLTRGTTTNQLLGGGTVTGTQTIDSHQCSKEKL